MFWSIPFVALVTFHASTADKPSCESEIYCQGKLLDLIQMAPTFDDSKTFVDMHVINTVEETLANFHSFLKTTQNPTPAQIKAFVEDNFIEGNELEAWTPPDYPENPSLPKKVHDPDVKRFAENIINIWPNLARKIKEDVFLHQDRYSLIPVRNGFIIPGGRFREFYYWDSYWIIQGLLLSEMPETVKGMLENFLSLVNRFGFIPNGARVYYLNRSQPPLLTMMIDAYLDYTNDTAWLKENIELIDKELKFWLDKKTIDIEKNGVTYTVAHYFVDSGSPRPESYREDVLTAEFWRKDEEKKQLWANLKSGAESGWDFSSRWIVGDNGSNEANISFVNPRQIIPVDLNSYLFKNFILLSKFYVQIGDFQNGIFWMEKANLWQKTIEQVFYDKDDGIWYDYDHVKQQPRKHFYPSNFAPLWADVYDSLEAKKRGKRAAAYFKSKGLLKYPGGIPTSLQQTGEQWDFPNAWAPLQTIVIEGLEKSGDEDARKLAKELAQNWIQANMLGFDATSEIFEKYDAVIPGEYGGGGEYTVQSGFGWSNGAVLKLINSYYC